MSSPYPFSYTYKWPLYFLWPSTKNHTNIEKALTQVTSNSKDSSTERRIIFIGDMMVMQGDVIPQFHPKLTELVSSADLVIGNCEAPIGNQPRNSKSHYNFSFLMPLDSLRGILDQFGASCPQVVLSTANNHSGDRGVGAYLATIPNLRELDVIPLGQWNNNKDPVTIVDINGMRLGITSWTHWMNNDVFKKNPGVNRWHDIETANWKKIKDDNKIDYLIGFPHWEYEFQHSPQWETRSIANQLMNSMGFDLIVGSHTHTLLPMEKFNNKHCFYSIGNFCGLGVAWPVKLIPILEVSLLGANKTEMTGYKLNFFYQNHTRNGIEIIPLEDAPEKPRKKLMKLISKIYSVYDEDSVCAN